MFILTGLLDSNQVFYNNRYTGIFFRSMHVCTMVTKVTKNNYLTAKNKNVKVFELLLRLIEKNV
jgi:hypothetical protein